MWISGEGVSAKGAISTAAVRMGRDWYVPGAAGRPAAGMERLRER